ncbi:hypothetical protein [Psychromonas ossibalaenae]|uniref:hypothetical protein n=1 Tax=Psychromonas ossibalaenae TaxID=444922 RepID=UPI00036CADFE|nr:hypothetical protein [Psychromonas ossibalaenae]
MATVIQRIFFGLLLLIIHTQSTAHTIYAPNDIPLLDNRFRIDPNTEQITFILNHSEGPRRVVLVRPDGSKIYYKRNPENVGWVTSRTQDIVTIDNPMAGPWQAVAKLDGNNRIKLMSRVELKTSRLPLKLYSQEYITTHASLYNEKKLMTNKAYLDDAKLSVALIGGASKTLTLYQDDGKGYDALPFDGKLTARVYVDLLPGRYLLNIRTKNDVFIRNVNHDAVVFLPPVSYEVDALEAGSDQALFEFKIDADELDPLSVTINGVIKDADNNIVEQLIIHSADGLSEQSLLTTVRKLSHNMFTFSAKAFATTRKGREIELHLPDRVFELVPPIVIPEANLSEALATVTEELNIPQETPSLLSDWRVITVAATLFSLLLIAIVFILLRRRKKNKLSDDNSEASLSLDELQPTSIDLKEDKK